MTDMPRDVLARAFEIMDELKTPASPNVGMARWSELVTDDANIIARELVAERELCADEIARLRHRIDDLLEANNRYQQEARDARRMAGKTLTAHGLADALDCFWNAAISEAHSRGFEAMSTATVMAVGLAAVAARLKEPASDSHE